MSVTLRDVVLAVSYGDASLVGESAGYLILGAADAAVSSRELASLDAIFIDEEGSVRLRGPQADDDDAERALRQLLGALLRKVRIPSNNLERVAARSQPRGLPGLVAELEAALVPVNRRAARRTLARLCREAKKSAARQHTFAAVEEVAPQPHPQPPTSHAADLSPEPAPVHRAPSPAPVEVAAVSRAEQTVGPSARRASQLPTVPAQPERHLLDALAGSFGTQTPAETSPPVVTRAPRSESVQEFGAGESYELGDDDFDVDVVDELDDAPTQVFAGVAPVALPSAETRASAAVAFAPAPVAPPRRRRHAVIPRKRRQIAEEDSLIVMSESAPRRIKSDISELLDKMSVSPMSTDSLYQGLKTLSKIELSPLAPPVGAARMDDPDR